MMICPKKIQELLENLHSSMSKRSLTNWLKLSQAIPNQNTVSLCLIFFSERRATKMLQRNIQISNVLTDNRNAQDFLQDMLNEKKGSLEKRINRNTKLKEELHNEISKRRKAHKKKLLPNLRSIKSQTLKNKNLESGKGWLILDIENPC